MCIDTRGRALALSMAVLLCGCGIKGDPDIVQSLGPRSALAIIVSEHPDMLAKARAAIHDDGHPMSTDSVRAQNAVIPLMNEYFHGRFQGMNDTLMLRYGDLISQRTMEMIDAHDDCMRIIEGRDFFANSFGLERTSSFFVDLSRAQPIPDPRMETPEALSAFIVYNGALVARNGGLTLDGLMAVLGRQDASPAGRCRMLAGTLKVLAGMPPADAAPLVRTILSSNHSATGQEQ